MANKFNIGDFVKMATSGWTPDAFNSAMDRIEKMNTEQANEEGEPTEEVIEESDSPEEVIEESIPDDKDMMIENLQNQIKDLQTKFVHQSAPEPTQKADEDIINDALLGLLN